MTAAYQEAQKRHAEFLAESLVKAQALAIEVRDTVRNHLRVALPGTFTLDVQDRPNGYNGHTERSLVVKAEDGTSYRLRFICVQTGKYRSSGYTVSISGERYERNGRSHCPSFEPRKDRTFNLKALTDDVRAAIERRRHEAQYRAAVESAEQGSRATFAAIGWQTSYPGASYATRDYGRFNVTINAGNISGGKVRVQVKLKDEYLDADQVAELLERLEVLK